MEHLCSNCVFEYHGCGNMSRKNNDSGRNCCQWKHDGSSDKPRTIVPRKTWLDEMAHDYAKIISEEFLKINRCTPLNLSNSANIISEHAYKLATAMLAEKMKSEATNETV